MARFVDLAAHRSSCCATEVAYRSRLPVRHAAPIQDLLQATMLCARSGAVTSQPILHWSCPHGATAYA